MAEMVRVEEAYIERDETINAQGAVMEIEIPYLVFGVADESAALELLKGASPFEDASLFYWHKESRTPTRKSTTSCSSATKCFGSLDGGRIRIIPLYMIGEYDRILRCMSFSCLPVEMSGRLWIPYPHFRGAMRFARLAV